MRTVLPSQAIRDIYQAVKELDAARVVIDPERDIAHVWSPDAGAALTIRMNPAAGADTAITKIPMDVLDPSFGEPETPHDAGLRRAVAVTVIPGRELSPMVRSALADLTERRRINQIHGSKDKTVQIRIGGGFVEIGPLRLEAPTWGDGETMINGGYLLTAINHAFGMVPFGVQLEIHEGGAVRVLMQSPNGQIEPDTRWRGQALIGPVVTRDRKKAEGNHAPRP